ncbi:hypothetical protein HK405_000164, partial [Cladochytrium tenue]
LVLEPLNGTFLTKQLELSATGPAIKVGRKVSAKVGSERYNGVFDSKVLSRTHAEIWYEAGKVWVKDVGSSNGTFLNGDRLSEEAKASLPFEIKTGDELVFGIDIATDDQATGMYQKVACLVRIVEPGDLSFVRTESSQRGWDSAKGFGGMRVEQVLQMLE